MKTKCEVIQEREEADEQIAQMPPEAADFEEMGWTMSFEIAKRCTDRDCDVCHG